MLCGVDYNGHGEYTVEGIQALADALCVTTSMSYLIAYGNNLGDEGKAILREAVKEKPGFELQL